MTGVRAAFHLTGLWTVLLAPGGLRADDEPLAEIKASLATPTRTIPVGKPIWITFGLQNLSPEPIKLTVPGTQLDEAGDAANGLPLAHVFSGRAFSGLQISGDAERTWDVAVGYTPPGRALAITIAPYASVGLQLDATHYYPALKSPGRYRVQWSPYAGRLRSNVLMLEIAPLKQAVLETDFGTMTIRFFYEDAPEHVANFIELAKKSFYDNLTFHRIEPGFYILGGCPHGDGTGIRPDGKKLQAEVNDRPVVKGTVLMGRLENDPDSASCQFFISNTAMPEIEGRYTVFGELAGHAALATLDQLMAQPVDDTGRPKKRVYIRGIRIVDAPAVPKDDMPADRASSP